MLSRVADSLYWMSRNIERAENNGRVLGVQLIQMLEASSEDSLAKYDWEAVIEICGSLYEFNQLYDHFSVNNVIDYLAFSTNNSSSILSCIKFARENARVTRDIIPGDLFEVWNDLYLESSNGHIPEGSLKEVHDFIKRVKIASLTSQGVIESSMSRGVPYRFIKIAKWLERAEKTTRILNVLSEKSSRDAERAEGTTYYYWRSALQLLNGYDEYLKKYPPRMYEKDVLTFLVTDYAFPRSIQYCMDHVREAIIALEGGKVSHYSWRMYAALDRLMDDFDGMKLKSLDVHQISAYLDEFQDRCNDISEVFSQTYYLIEPSHVP